MIDIKFCECNYKNGTESVVNLLKDTITDGEIQIVNCLGICGECSSKPCALVNDKLVKADTPDQLYKKIIKKSESLMH